MKQIKINILHIVDENNISSVNKEIVWGDSSTEVIGHLINDIGEHPIILGRKTWEANNNKPFGKTQNFVLSRKHDLFLPRSVKRLGFLTELKGYDKGEYTLLGGCSAIHSIPEEFLNTIIIYRLKHNALSACTKVHEFTKLNETITDRTKIIEDHDSYSIHMWSSCDVDI